MDTNVGMCYSEQLMILKNVLQSVSIQLVSLQLPTVRLYNLITTIYYWFIATKINRDKITLLVIALYGRDGQPVDLEPQWLFTYFLLAFW